MSVAWVVQIANEGQQLAFVDRDLRHQWRPVFYDTRKEARDVLRAHLRGCEAGKSCNWRVVKRNRPEPAKRAPVTAQRRPRV